MPKQAEHAAVHTSGTRWSNRILIAATAGILFLTLFPFRFASATSLSLGASPFLLGRSPKTGTPIDMLLNILLFIPFGFGLAEKLREQQTARKVAFMWTILAGALFSYTIEFLQIYIPSRDSGWEDVFTNSAGAACGFVLYELIGNEAVRLLSHCESLLIRRLTARRAVMILLLYFALSFAISIPLQQESLLRNWDPDTFLVVGNNAQAQYPWRGEVQRVQIWDRALPEQLARELTAGAAVGDAQNSLVGDYEFSGAASLQDRQSLLPDLTWTPFVPNHPDSSPLTLDGNHWLISKLHVSGLVNDVRKTNQFAVRVVCVLGEVNDEDRRIVTISNSSGVTNLTLRQEGSSLVFWFRNALSVKRSLLAWYTPKVFDAIERHDILFSYDGSNLSLFIDGRKESRAYRLGPGTALAQLLVQVTPAELDGYRYIYYALVFLPAGVLMGFAVRNGLSLPMAAVLLAIGACVPPTILEWILICASGRTLSAANLLLSFLLSVAGAAWINSDRRVP
jgi:glycopeptide antibiotics resistance protein